MGLFISVIVRLPPIKISIKIILALSNQKKWQLRQGKVGTPLALERYIPPWRPGPPPYPPGRYFFPLFGLIMSCSIGLLVLGTEWVPSTFLGLVLQLNS